MGLKLFIKKTVIVLLLLFLFLNLCGLFLDYQLRRSNVFKINILFNNKLPNNIILGSSRSLTGINTELFTKLTKAKWYNLSMDDTKTETHLLFLNILIGLNKTPSRILLQYDRENPEVDSTTFFDNDYQLLPYINSNEIISDYFKHKANFYHFKFLPIYKYIYFNTELFFPSVLTFFKPQYHHRFIENTGDYNYPKDYVMKDSSTKFKKYKIVLKNPVMNNFISNCNKNNIKLYVYTAPIYHVEDSSDTSTNNYFNFSSIYFNANKFSDNFHIANNTKNDFTLKLATIFNVVY